MMVFLMNTITIHYKVRPKKTAFLVNPELGMEPILSAIEYCQREWGGRFNPIIPTDGKSIVDSWMKLLKLFDPDEILAVPDIDDALKSTLESSLTFTKYDSFEPDGNGTDRTLKAHEHSFHINNVIPLYESKHRATYRELPDMILRLSSLTKKAAPFYAANFGVFEDVASVSELFSKMGEHVKIDLDEDSDINVFDYFCKKGKNHITLNDLASYKAYPELFEGSNVHENDSFQVIIGDSPLNVLYMWDRVFLLGGQQFTHPITRHQIWLPNNVVDELLSEPVKLDAFIEMAKRRSRCYIKFVSFDSVNQRNDDFKKKVEEGINKKTGSHVYATAVNYMTPEQFSDINTERRLSLSRSPATCVLTEQKNDTSTYSFEMPKPDILQRIDLTERRYERVAWAVDIQIDKYAPHISNKNEKHRFPYRRDISFAFRPGRVSRHGDIVMSSDASQKQGLLKMPSQNILFSHLLTCCYYTIFPKADESQRKQNMFKSIAPSDKGKYQRGVIGLFRSLENASRYFESPFWRELLLYMSGRNPKFDEQPKSDSDELFENIRKCASGNLYRKTSSGFEAVNDDEHTCLAVNLVEKFNNIKGRQKEVTRNEIKSYRKHFKREKFTDDDFESYFEFLVESNILLQGYRPKCTKCGSSLWYPLDEVKKYIVCKGCENVFHMPPEEKWSYRLNTLCANTIREHGIIPVILSLRNLQEFDWESFEFYPSQDLIINEVGNVKREIDIVCLFNGMLIIGEVKSSDSGIKMADFEKCKQVAFQIKPDIFVFYIMKKENDISDEKRAMISDFQIELEREGIKVIPMFPPEGIFDRSVGGSMSLSMPNWILNKGD